MRLFNERYSQAFLLLAGGQIEDPQRLLIFTNDQETSIGRKRHPARYSGLLGQSDSRTFLPRSGFPDMNGTLMNALVWLLFVLQLIGDRRHELPVGGISEPACEMVIWQRNRRQLPPRGCLFQQKSRREQKGWVLRVAERNLGMKKPGQDP